MVFHCTSLEIRTKKRQETVSRFLLLFNLFGVDFDDRLSGGVLLDDDFDVLSARSGHTGDDLVIEFAEHDIPTIGGTFECAVGKSQDLIVLCASDDVKLVPVGIGFCCRNVGSKIDERNADPISDVVFDCGFDVIGPLGGIAGRHDEARQSFDLENHLL